ncbi:unnamed protein product [Urochloa humidicola]
MTGMGADAAALAPPGLGPSGLGNEESGAQRREARLQGPDMGRGCWSPDAVATWVKPLAPHPSSQQETRRQRHLRLALGRHPRGKGRHGAAAARDEGVDAGAPATGI